MNSIVSNTAIDESNTAESLDPVTPQRLGGTMSAVSYNVIPKTLYTTLLSWGLGGGSPNKP